MTSSVDLLNEVITADKGEAYARVLHACVSLAVKSTVEQWDGPALIQLAVLIAGTQVTREEFGELLGAAKVDMRSEAA